MYLLGEQCNVNNGNNPAVKILYVAQKFIKIVIVILTH